MFCFFMADIWCTQITPIQGLADHLAHPAPAVAVVGPWNAAQ